MVFGINRKCGQEMGVRMGRGRLQLVFCCSAMNESGYRWISLSYQLATL